MKYLSTRNNNLKESFTNILFQGLSKDGGLYLPESWPLLDINTLRDKSYEEVALNIISPFVANEVSEEDLYEIIISTYKDFSHSKIAPLYKIDNNKYILELFYGPTFAFKDYAMQFLSELFSEVLKTSKSKSIFLRKKPVWVFIKNKLLSISSSEIRRVHNLNKTEFQI